MLKQQHQVFVGLLACVDGAVITGASFAAFAVRHLLIEHPWLPQSWEQWPKDALVLYTVPIVLLSLHWFGLYRARRDRTLLNEVYQVVKASMASMLAILAVLYVFESSVFNLPLPSYTVGGHSLDAGRVQLAALTLALPTFLAIHRVMFRKALRELRRRGWNLRHVAVIGAGRLGQVVARTLERNSWTGLKVAYFISHQDRTRRTTCLGKPVLGGLADLERIMETHKPDAVYLAMPMSKMAQITSVLARLEKFAVDVRIVPDMTPRHLPQSMVVNEIDGMPMLSYRENPTSGLGGVGKRVVDVVGALAAMAFFSPLMVLIALLVRLSGPGPIVFKQPRVSLGGQVFSIYKFRTMYHATDERNPRLDTEASWTQRDDPRITPIGRWLRQTSLDELPQLINVLTGEMSLVGPRPERPELIERFREDWRGYMLRQHVKAGMTGWAQVNGLRGQTSLRKRLQYDLFYIRHWSIGFDLKILWLTLFRGFLHRNAH